MGHFLRNAAEHHLSTLAQLKPMETEAEGIQRFRQSQRNTEELV